MTEEQIQNLIYDICEAYDLEIEDLNIDDQTIELEVSHNEAEFNIELEIDSDITKDELTAQLEQELYNAVDNYDPDETLMEYGLNESDINAIEQIQDTTDEINTIKEDLNNSLRHQNYTSFQEDIMNQLKNEAQNLIDDGYKNLKLMQEYTNEMSIIAQSEPIYNQLEKILDQTDSTSHVFLYAPNFFSFMTSGTQRNIINEYQQNPHACLDKIIHFNNLKVKDGVDY